MDQALNDEEAGVRIHLSARAAAPGARPAEKAADAARSKTRDGYRDELLFSLANGEHYEVMFSFEGEPLSVTLDLHG